MKHLLYNASNPLPLVQHGHFTPREWADDAVNPKRHSIFRVLPRVAFMYITKSGNQKDRHVHFFFFMSQHCTKLLQLRAAFTVSSGHLLAVVTSSETTRHLRGHFTPLPKNPTNEMIKEQCDLEKSVKFETPCTLCECFGLECRNYTVASL